MSDKVCSRCKKEKSLNLYNVSLRNKDKRADWCKSCIKFYRRSEQGRNRNIKYRWNITLSDQKNIRQIQDNKCAICHTDFIYSSAVIDHDHSCCPGAKSCGKCIRGMLCVSCNTGLGMFKDNISALLSAARYLQKNGIEYSLEDIELSIYEEELVYDSI